MTLRKLIYQAWEEIEGLNITDDTLIEYDYLKDKFIVWNQTLLVETYNSKLPIDGFFQMLDCVEVECVQRTCTIDGHVFKTDTVFYQAQLPQLVLQIPNNIRYFGGGMLEKGISRVSIDGFMKSIFARFTNAEPIYTTIGSTLIAKNMPTTGFARAMVLCLLSDPTTACNWDEYDNSEFPTPSPAKLLMLVKKDILSMVGRPDLINDSQIAVGSPKQPQAQPEGE